MNPNSKCSRAKSCPMKPKKCANKNPNGFVLVDGTQADMDNCIDEDDLKQQLYFMLQPKFNFRDIEPVSPLALEKKRLLLTSADKCSKNPNSPRETNMDVIESTINIQKYRDGKIKKSINRTCSKFYPPPCKTETYAEQCAHRRN